LPTCVVHLPVCNTCALGGAGLRRHARQASWLEADRPLAQSFEVLWIGPNMKTKTLFPHDLPFTADPKRLLSLEEREESLRMDTLFEHAFPLKTSSVYSSAARNVSGSLALGLRMDPRS